MINHRIGTLAWAKQSDFTDVLREAVEICLQLTSTIVIAMSASVIVHHTHPYEHARFLSQIMFREIDGLHTIGFAFQYTNTSLRGCVAAVELSRMDNFVHQVTAPAQRCEVNISAYEYFIAYRQIRREHFRTVSRRIGIYQFQP